MLTANGEMFQTLSTIRLLIRLLREHLQITQIRLYWTYQKIWLERTNSYTWFSFIQASAFIYGFSLNNLTYGPYSESFHKSISKLRDSTFPDQESYNHRKLYPSYKNSNFKFFLLIFFIYRLTFQMKIYLFIWLGRLALLSQRIGWFGQYSDS